MSTKLLVLSEIPAAARKIEQHWRKQFESPIAALAAANYRIEPAPGCFARTGGNPPIFGWVGTQVAAEAIAAQLTYILGTPAHHRRTFTKI